MSQTRVVIVGGGFGGLGVAKRLLSSSITSSLAITIVDSSPVHIYTPWLYEIASSGIGSDDDRDEAVKTADVSLATFSGIRFRHVAMMSIDRKEQRVLLADKTTVAYDILVLALGSVSNDFGIPGVREHASDLKTVSDALLIRSMISEIVRAGTSAHIVVVGAGPNGSELAAECAVVLRALTKRGKIPEKSINVTLVDVLPNPLGTLAPSLQRLARRRLRSLGVHLRMDCGLKSVQKESVTLQSMHEGKLVGSEEVLPSDCTVVALGMKMPDVINVLPYAKSSKGRILVDASLRVQGEQRIFALGDCAARIEGSKGKADPQTAQVAVGQAEVVAQNILSTIRNGPMRTYRQRSYWDIMVALGGKYAVGTLLGTSIAGYTAYMIRRFIDARYFLSILPKRQTIMRMIKGAVLYEKNERV